MKMFFNKVINIGIDKTVHHSEIRYIKLLNALAFFVVIFELFNMILFYPFIPNVLLLIFGTTIGFLNLAVLVLNYFKFYLIARVLFGLLAIVFITVYSLYMGPESMMSAFLLESIVIAFFIYPPKHKIARNIMVLLFCLIFLSLDIWFDDHDSIIKHIPEIINFDIATGLALFMLAISFYTYTIIKNAENLLEKEKLKSENLLLNILPKSVAMRLKEGSIHIADYFNEVTILFSDIVDFTPLSRTMTAEQVVSMLDEMVVEFDRLSDQYGLEKIKTIGDSYMVAGGIPEKNPKHCHSIAEMALSMQHVMHTKFSQKYNGIKLRIGIHTGPVVAGVIGRKKFTYDLWGDSVNLASRMEKYDIVDKIQVTKEVYEKLKNEFLFEDRGKIKVKGEGIVHTYFLIGKLN